MVSLCNSLQQVHFLSSPSSIKFSSPLLVPFSISFPPALSSGSHALPVRALKTGPDGGKIVSSDTAAASSELLRRPIVKEFSRSEEVESRGERKEEMSEREEEEEVEEEEEGGETQEWVDWEDKILEDTVPLVGFARMILHSGRYQSGDRLRPDHEKTVVEKLLPYHPEWQKKIGCGIDYITVGYHPDFDSSRCLFIVRKDGELVDFSYWKCIKGLIRKKYPLYADSFILRHFRRQRRSDRK